MKKTQFVLIDVTENPLNIQVLKDNLNMKHNLYGISTSFIRFQAKDKTYCKNTCIFPITEYYTFTFDIATEQLILYIFTIDKDHNNIEMYTYNTNIFKDIHVKSISNRNNDLGLMDVVAQKGDGTDYHVLIQIGDKDTPMTFYDESINNNNNNI